MFERTGQHAHAGAEQLGLADFLGHDWEDLIATDWLYAPYGGARIGIAGGE